MIDQTGEHGAEHGGDEPGTEPWDEAAKASPEDHAAAFGTPESEPITHDRLALGEEERLPWLDSADDVDHEPQDSGRMAGFVALGLLALAALIGGIYWVSHGPSASSQADGSLIEASKTPYKVEPANPGGKTFEGTGDSSYKVSEGKHPDGSGAAGAKGAEAKAAADGKTAEAKASLTTGPTTGPAAGPTKAAEAKPAGPKPAAATAGASGGVGVQVGAFSSHAAAEAAWSKLAGQYSALSGHGHRIVEGQADIGTVYRLQALAADAGAATALCGTLQGAGLHCQVKP